jgi:hypothetical protein
MEHVFVKKTAITAGLALLMAGCGRDEIGVYSVPKEKSANAQQVAVEPSGITSSPTWETPSDWKELAPTSIRIGNLLIEGQGGKKAEVAITSFPGSVGTELDNWNRWRGEIGLAPTEADKISSEPVKVGADDAKLYDMTGEQLRTVVAMLPRGGSTWFFKVRGDKEVVESSKSTFISFLKTVKFDGGQASASVATSSRNQAPADPHANIPGAPPLGKAISEAKPAAAAGSGGPVLDIPPEWKEVTPGPMVLKSYTIGEGEARLAISSLGGAGGGVLMNVNRWRGQLGLDPISEGDLPTTTTSFDAGDTKATLVDISGTEAKTGSDARMIAVMVPKGDETWFYKLTGDETVVGQEKEALIKVVQTARY